jgi:hypothetical protein
MPKCIELVAVMSDGTVFRWEGHDAFILGAQMPLPCEQKAIGMITPPEPTTTKPLRKVTEVRGRHDTHEADCIVDDGDGVYLSDLLPSGPARGEILLSGAYRGDDCDFRITVEATPVEVEP